MKITILLVGKTNSTYLREGIDEYSKRLKHYGSVDFKIIPEIKNTKNMSPEVQKEKEGELILQQVGKQDFLILLDENGKQLSSVGFSKFLSSKFQLGIKRMIFVLGGAYGFSNQVYAKCQEKLSLSKMTFSHQMVRLIFIEQLYRAFTILKGEPYHHQ